MLKYLEFLNENVSDEPIMDKINSRVKKEIIPLLSKNYTLTYDKGKSIVVKSNKDKFSFRIFIEKDSDKITVEVAPLKPPTYELNYVIDNESINNIINLIVNEIKNIEDIGDLNDDDSLNDIEFPKKSIKKKNNNTIDIDIVQDVLEEAFVNDEIILKKVDINELLLRMMKKS
jgi:hypothetical protein